MWICRNCGTDNEDNFKFCWGCGQSRAKAEAVPEPPPVKPKPVEKVPDQPKTVKSIPEPIEKPPVIKEEIPQIQPPTVSKPKPQFQKTNDDEEVLPMLARVAGVESGYSLNDDDVSLERKVFTIAVRLVGLFLLYQVFVALPDLIVLIKSSVGNTENFSDALTSQLVIPVAKVLFYFIIGIYLIAGGRILLRLLPD